MHDNFKWDGKQVDYWNTIAHSYDSFYTSQWSELENKQVLNVLQTIIKSKPTKVLDLACGTGLGYHFCQTISSNINYVGIDISEEMIEVFQTKYPNAAVSVGDMSNLKAFTNNSFDVVIALNSSLSYCFDTSKVLNEIYRVLKVNGCILVSVFNKHSLRRFIHNWRYSSTEKSHTRGDKKNTNKFAPAQLYTPNQVKELLNNKGFSEIFLLGQGFFSGVAEKAFLWEIDVVLAKALPQLCHCSYFQARKV